MLFCGDLFTQTGKNAVTGEDVVGPAIALEERLSLTANTPFTGPAVTGLAELNPSVLALMHGPTFTGKGAAALRDLGAYYSDVHATSSSRERRAAR